MESSTYHVIGEWPACLSLTGALSFYPSTTKVLFPLSVSSPHLVVGLGDGPSNADNR